MEPGPPSTILTPVVRKEAADLDFIWWEIGSAKGFDAQSDLRIGTITPEAIWRIY